jgi:hypothetical protein
LIKEDPGTSKKAEIPYNYSPSYIYFGRAEAPPELLTKRSKFTHAMVKIYPLTLRF